MGLIRAAAGALGGVLADQWKEFFYCDALPNDVLMRKGQKQISGRSSNTKGNDNIISNGSGIAVADGQCMIIVEQGRIVEVCAEPGEFTYNNSTEPSIFSGKFGDSLKDSFKTFGKRFTYGGDTAKDQRVYYFNTKEILDNKFGTANPIIFEVVNKRINMSRTVQVRCNGVYTYIITDPLLFYTRLCGNVADEFTRDQIDAQLKTEFVDALQPAFGALAEQELRPAQIPAKAKELKAAMNEALKQDWIENRGISVGKIALNPITLTDTDMKKINEMEDAASVGSNAFMLAGRMTNATADTMQTAAGNSAGAMTGFMGMGMVGMGQAGGFGAAQNLFAMGQQQAAQQQMAQQQPTVLQTQAPPQNTADQWTCRCGATASGKFCPECGTKKPEPVQADAWKCTCGATVTGKFCPECGSPKPAEQEGWTCTCGAVNKGKFCPNCGAKKPEGAPLYRCDKCGWQPEDPHNPPKFCPECGDTFDDNDKS
ncbi:MAG: SPFH domain-containing protein [Clostridiaceae bacterium]|nr:SPFH domain-containing protein [Clostridiaceae bacterium]MDY5889668.1 SPFH domain-containing protein [Oscillospiraceae bacterium]